MSETLKEKALKEGVPIIKDEGLAFLLNIIREHDCIEILELGTAVGYSAIQMASLDRRIHVDTLEKNEELYQEAVENIAQNGLSAQITPYHTAIE